MQKAIQGRATRIGFWLSAMMAFTIPAVQAQVSIRPTSLIMTAAGSSQAGQVSTGQIQSAQALSLIGPGPIGAATTTAQFAHFATGGGYTTTFTFLNTGTTPLTGTLFLTGQDGAPFTANLSSGNTQTSSTSIPLNINPGGTQFVTAAALAGSDPTKAGWARVESTGGTLGGVGTFEKSSASGLETVAGVLSSESVTVATIPVDDDVPANRYTGYAIANPSATGSITVTVQAVNADGTLGAALSPVTLTPGKQTAAFFFQDPAASHVFKGSVVLSEQTGKPFVVVALVQNQGLFTAIPVIPAKAPNIP